MLSFYLILLEDPNDKVLFTELHEKYEKKMFGVAMKYLNSKPKAEDAVQDSFIKIIYKFETYKRIPRNEVTAWIVTIVKNTALDKIKGESRLTQMDEDFEVPTETDFDGKMGFEAVVACIRKMPENVRRILELKYVLQWSNIEIAAHLNMSEGAVAGRIHRSRGRLLELLSEEGYESGAEKT